MLQMVLLLSLLNSAAVAAPRQADCEVYWLFRGGKEDPEYIRIKGGWPLLQFARNAPYWYFGQGDELQWRPLAKLGSIRPLGQVTGVRAYEVTYSPLHRVIVWDRGDWSFCPALMAYGDETIVTRIDAAERFQWSGTDVLHTRVQYAGTGHFQESLFFAVVDGALTHLRRDESGETLVTAFYNQHGLEPFHRGLGFCSQSLVERRLAAPGGAGVTVTYRVDGRRLVAERVEFAVWEKKDCKIFP